MASAPRVESPDSHLARARCLLDLNRPADAIACINAFLGSVLPHNFNAHLLKGKAHLQLGEFAEGWSLYEARAHGVLGSSPKWESRQFLPTPWLGVEDVADKTVWVRCEAGFGDTLQFCRYAFLLKMRGARVILSVHNSLVRFLSRLDPEIEVVSTGEGDELAYTPGAWDYQTPLESLPLAFKTRLATIPAAMSYVTPDPADVGRWAGRLGTSSKPRIGIVWSGNPGHPQDCDRSAALDRLRGLFDFDADWICPQKDLRPEDIATLNLSGRTSYFGDVRFFGDDIQDFADTAALVANLDLVISVDTSIAHLAAAMGKPTWIMLPFAAEWRWLMHRDDCPWYPTARLFRQPRAGDWDSVVERIVGELRGLSVAQDALEEAA